MGYLTDNLHQKHLNALADVELLEREYKHLTTEEQKLTERLKERRKRQLMLVSGHLQSAYDHDWRVLKVTEKRVYVQCFNRLNKEFVTLDGTGCQSYFPNIDIEASVKAYRAWEASK